MLGVIDSREVVFCSGDVGGGRMLIPVACLAGIAGVSRDDMMMHVIRCKEDPSLPREAIRYLGDEYYVDSRWLLGFAVPPVFSAEAKEFLLAAVRQHSTNTRYSVMFQMLQAAITELNQEKERYKYEINQLAPIGRFQDRILRRLASTPDELVSHSDLLRACSIPASTMDHIIRELVLSHQVKIFHEGRKKYYQVPTFQVTEA